MLRMIKANKNDLDQIEEFYSSCITYLNDKGVFQWDYRYPNLETYKSSISHQSQFVFYYEDVLIGAVILNEIQADEWDGISWHYMDMKTLIIHALAISPSFHGKGFGQKVLTLCEIYGVKNDYKVVRLDVFSENEVALKLYEKNGYKKAGDVTFSTKPLGHQLYLCYDKAL